MDAPAGISLSTPDRSDIYLPRRRRAVAGKHAALLRGGQTLVGPPAPAPLFTRVPGVAGSGA